MVNTEFIEALASKAPTPGGGGASAYVGVLASALASMVGNLTVGKKKYADVEERVQAELLELEATRLRLLELIDADAEAFAPLAAAYGMARDTDGAAAAQRAALQVALVDACEVPLEIMRQCVQVIESCVFMAKHGSVLAVSDAGAGAVLAKAALLAASLNVRINIASMDDAVRAGILKEADVPREIREVIGDTPSSRLDHFIHDIVTASMGRNDILMSERVEWAMKRMRAFMFENVYLNPVAKSEENKAEVLMETLYRHFMKHVEELPEEFLNLLSEGDVREQVVCDYVGAMTDRYAIATYERIYIPKYWSF